MQVKLMLVLLLIISICANASAQSVSAVPADPAKSVTNESHLRDPVVEFAKAIVRNDLKRAQKYVVQDDIGVHIPDIRETSRFTRYQIVPSTMAGVYVLLVHCEDKALKRERLAFIWEIAVKRHVITKIRVLYDGSNPLGNEAQIIREYQMKYRQHVLVPTEVTVFPIAMELDRYRGKDDVYYTLKDSTRALYRSKFELGYELRFQKNGLHYQLTIGNKKYLKVKYRPETLIRIANSMV